MSDEKKKGWKDNVVKLLGSNPDAEKMAEKVHEYIDEISKAKEPVALLQLYLEMGDKTPNASFSFLGSMGFLKNINHDKFAGFYCVLNQCDTPFFSGDVLFFATNDEYKKGDIIRYWDLDDDNDPTFNFVKFEYIKDGRLVVRSFSEGDGTKYSISNFKVLGRLTNSISLGETKWKEFVIQNGLDLDKLRDEMIEEVERYKIMMKDEKYKEPRHQKELSKRCDELERRSKIILKLKEH